MTELYFIRHCQPNYENHDDTSRELSPKGRADIRLVTEYLRGKGIGAVLSSPFKRAFDTVAPFARDAGLPVATMDGLRERQVDSGWIEDFDSFARRQWEDFSYKLDHGESLGQVQGRMVGCLDEILAGYEGQRVAVGSHGTALSVLVHTFRPGFGYGGFQRIRGLMPWAVHFTFSGKECVNVEETDLFTGETKSIGGPLPGAAAFRA